MRKAVIQFVVLVVAGIVIAWKEWEIRGRGIASNMALDSTSTPTLPSVNPVLVSETISVSQSSVIWMVIATGILFLLAECISKSLFKLSSPNSV